MEIWVCSIGEPLPIDPHNPRLMRCGVLCEELIAQGHKVTLWSSTFSHALRSLRAEKTTEVDLKNNYSIVLLHGGIYEKNVSFARIKHHKKVAKEFARLAPHKTKPDLILSSLPIVDLAYEATKFGKLNNIPTMVEIRDLWPTVFIDLFPTNLKWLVQIASYPMLIKVKQLCANTTAISGNSPLFVNWGLKMAERAKTPLDKDFPFGYTEPAIDQAKTIKHDSFWAEQGLDKDRDFICCFFGTIGQMFDFKTVIKAAKTVQELDSNIKFVICGDGTKFDELKLATKDQKNIIWPGRIDKNQIWSLMERSHIGLAPYHNTENFLLNMPNKPAEYFCGSLPVASAIEGYLGGLIKKYNCGFCYSSPNELVQNIINMKGDPKKMKQQSQSARTLYLENFQANKIYKDYVGHIENIAKL